MSGTRRQPRPRPLALIDPIADWHNGPRVSRAQRDGLELRVFSHEGRWIWEVRPLRDKRPLMAGTAWVGWTRADAKDAATRAAARIIAERAREGDAAGVHHPAARAGPRVRLLRLPGVGA